MSRRVMIVGAGMGGLTAALRLARAGFRVQVLEARSDPGGLASGFPMAFVPALIHTVGAFYPMGGIGVIPRVLAAAGAKAGVEWRYGITVRAIRCAEGRVVGVETGAGELIEAEAVVSNAGGHRAPDTAPGLDWR